MCEMPSCYGHEERKARKAHRCCECHGTIQPGEKYHFHHGVWDGEAQDYKVCADCEALRAECDRDARYDECTPFEGLHDSVEGIGEPGLLVRFAEIKRRRGATVSQWMATRVDTANAEREGCNVQAMVLPPILDPCCGSRMWWFDHADSRVLFGDRRRETLTVKDTSHGRADGRRVLRIEPDVDLDFRAMPFHDDTFHLVAFDPPHLVRAGAQSWMAAKYGKLGPDWREDLRAGFAECFRVLRPHGVLVFKWNETQVKVREVLALTPEPPLFGNTSGRKSGTHWIVFMKQNAPN